MNISAGEIVLMLLAILSAMIMIERMVHMSDFFVAAVALGVAGTWSPRRVRSLGIGVSLLILIASNITLLVLNVGLLG